jgi:hypothetical protein
MILQRKSDGKYYKFLGLDDSDGIGWTLKLEYIMSNKKRVKRSYTYYSLDQIIESLEKFEEVSPGEIIL